MPPWKAQAGPFKPPPKEPSPAENLVQTDSLLEATASKREVGSATPAPCPTKYIEVTLLDEHGTPVVGANCELELPDASGASAKTNSSGVARFDGRSTDATKAMLRITENDGGEGPPTYKIEVVPLKETPEDQAPPEQEDEDVRYYRPNWNQELAPPAES